MDKKIVGLLALLKSAVTGVPEQLPAEFSLEEAETLIIKQALTMVAFHGAMICGIPAELPVMQRLRMRYLRLLLQSERQMLAVENLLQALDNAGVDHMMVKGCDLKRLYPKPELRPMGDADILIRTEQYDRVKAVMESLGYTFRSENQHVYEWSTSHLHVELHKTLIPPSDRRFYESYGTGWKYARHRSGHRFELTPEDAFVFLVVHFARHYLYSGVGCRHVLDLYVYSRAYPELNWKYIESELRRLRLWEFCGNVMRTLDVWFHNGAADHVTGQITEFVFSGGDWGSLENLLNFASAGEAEKKGSVTNSKMHAFMNALFPSTSYMSYQYSVLLRKPWLTPVIWVIRWFDILLFRPQKVKRKIQILRTVNDATTAKHIQAFQEVGLDFAPDEQ